MINLTSRKLHILMAAREIGIGGRSIVFSHGLRSVCSQSHAAHGYFFGRSTGAELTVSRQKAEGQPRKGLSGILRLVPEWRKRVTEDLLICTGGTGRQLKAQSPRTLAHETPLMGS